MEVDVDQFFDPEPVRRAVAECLGRDPADVGEDDNLMEHGLDSLRMMALASLWQCQGVEIPFDRLAETPTVAAWSSLLSQCARAAIEERRR